MTTRAQHSVKQLVTHLKPHGDEIISFLALRKKGGDVYPGVEKAPVYFINDGKLPRGLTAEALLKTGMLAVGVGAGDLDEHTMIDGVRVKPRDCSFTLTAKVLGLDTDPMLKPLLEEVYHCDQSDKVWPTQLPTLIKVRYSQNPDKEGEYKKMYMVIEWATTAYDALWETGAEQIATTVDPTGLSDIYERLAVSQGWDKAPAESHKGKAYLATKEMVKDSESRSDMYLTELAHLRKVLIKSGFAGVDNWVAFVLIDMYNKNVKHWETVDEINTKGVFRDVQINNHSGGLTMLYIESDSQQVSSAARSGSGGYVGVVIQRNSAGNTMISLNRNDKLVRERRLSIDTLVSMVRTAEAIKRRIPLANLPPFEKLCVQGSVPSLEMWYRHEDMLLNGSTTTPNVARSLLTKEELCDIVRCSLNKVLTANWRCEYGDRIPHNQSYVKAGNTSNIAMLEKMVDKAFAGK
ncbi:MAG TPA: hypothetical protein VJH55_00900 [Candidatus Paceibacterota bacterium]